MKTKPFNPLFVFVIILALVLSACGAMRPAFKNTMVKPSVAAADFSMTDQHGNPFKLSNERGKVVVLYFGFVNCPDDCPLTTGHINQAVEALGDQAQNVQVVMVSTDPMRDTPQALDNFLAAFNPTFIGIPGNPDDLAKIYQAYGVEVLDGGETHSSIVYIIDKNGNLRLSFDPETGPDNIAADLKILLSE